MKEQINEKKAITIDLWKAMSILAVSVLTTGVGTAFTVARTLNTDHFKLVSVTTQVSALEQNCVKKDFYNLQIGSISADVTEIKADIKTLLNYH